jgi:hypothetical protein
LFIGGSVAGPVERGVGRRGVPHSEEPLGREMGRERFDTYLEIKSISVA